MIWHKYWVIFFVCFVNSAGFQLLLYIVDLFLLSDVSLSTTDIFSGADISFIFTITITNTQEDGYDLPESENGYPLFNWRVCEK